MSAVATVLLVLSASVPARGQSSATVPSRWDVAGMGGLFLGRPEETGEEQHLGPQEHPHPQADGVVLLLDGLEVVSQVRVRVAASVGTPRRPDGSEWISGPFAQEGANNVGAVPSEGRDDHYR